MGKGLLAKAPSVIAFGEPPQTVGLGTGDEFEKGLVAALLRGGHSILIDNINDRILRSNTPCSTLSERPAFLRIMGLGKLGPVNSTALISVTGCALSIGRDLVRRTIMSDLDAKIEDPEQREFQGDFLADIAARRLELLQYVFTILRWARQNPAALKRGKPLGSYGQWCAWVRDPLLTLGCPDPVVRLAELKVKDPDRINVVSVFEAWFRHHFDNWITANSLNYEVQQLLLHGRKHSRQRINNEVRNLVGTRIANYMLQEKKSDTSKWAAAEFRLIKTDSPRAREGVYDQPDEAAATSEAAASAEAAVAEAEDDADGRQFHREPKPAQECPEHQPLPPDALNAEGRLAVWRNAFAPLKAEIEPCPGWRSDEWARVHACCKQFLAGPAAFTAARNGWSALDLFAVHKAAGVAVRDCVGALTGNATNGFVAGAGADGALQFANGTKVRQRPLDPNLCIPIWSFRAPTTAPR